MDEDDTKDTTDGMYVHKGQPINTTELMDEGASKITTDSMYVHKHQHIITSKVVDDYATRIITDGMHAHNGQPIITTAMMDEDATSITTDGINIHKGQPIITTEVVTLLRLLLMVRRPANLQTSVCTLLKRHLSKLSIHVQYIIHKNRHTCTEQEYAG